TPSPAKLYQVLDATWPAEALRRVGPFTLRHSPGAGKRVGSATLEANATDMAAHLEATEAQMLAWDQIPTFRCQQDAPGLDAALEARGYEIVEPTVIYVVAPQKLVDIDRPRLSGFAHWPALAWQQELWTQAGIGPARQAVMDRASGAKTSILARHQAQPCGTAFVAVHDKIAMLHALEVHPGFRRLGNGERMLGTAAQWAQDQGCDWLSLAVTEANATARALYQKLGMQIAARYHYRQKRLSDGEA
ncbi:MAG: GNAT family N-acetyltransferase, partial [Mangrovicoccus sp.]